MLNLAAIIPDTQPVNWDEALSPQVYVFYAAFIVAFLFTPVMRSIATYHGIVDQPDKVRKLHSAPVAYLGGIAVFMGWVAGLAMSQIHFPSVEHATPHFRIKLCIVMGGVVIVLLGLWDDLKRIRPSLKIGGQVIAALLLLSQGVGLHAMDPIIRPADDMLQTALHIHHTIIPLALSPWLSSILVILMVVGCCNATNLMDGLDGLCGGVTAFIAAGFLLLAVHLATQDFNELNPVRIVLALALLGAVLGFVPYNFNPASIFMGDAGSMFLGYASATMILLLAEAQSKWLLASMVMFALPVLDTALAFMRRYVNGRPLFSADSHHFHHQLVARGYTVRQTVLISYGLAIMFCVLGALIAYMRTRYAVALYLVIFGSIIVAAYKMGMVHETASVASNKSLEHAGTVMTSDVPDAGEVLEISDNQNMDSSSSEPRPSGRTITA